MLFEWQSEVGASRLKKLADLGLVQDWEALGVLIDIVGVLFDELLRLLTDYLLEVLSCLYINLHLVRHPCIINRHD